MKKTIFFLPSIILIFLTYIIQTKLSLSADVGYLLHATNQMLAGGKYISDIFETNPPMIFYVYSPACLLAKWTTIDIISALRFYVLFLIALSMVANFFLLKKIIDQKDKIILFFMYYSLLLILLFLPVYSFGQREHVWLILIMPYLLSAVLELENKSIHPMLAFFIGLCAGIGFALKPFFIITLVLVELYFIVKKRHLFAWVRIESVTIASVFVAYILIIFLFQSNYYQIMLPLIYHFYFVSRNQPMEDILLQPLVLFCFLTIFSYMLLYNSKSYTTLGKVILLALIGMVSAFMIPRQAWYYHMLPAVSMACWLTVFYFSQVITSCVANRSSKIDFIQDMLAIFIMAFLIFVVPAVGLIIGARSFTETNKNMLSEKVIAYFHAHPKHYSAYCFSVTGTVDCFPLIYKLQSEYAGRYPFFWWYFGVQKLEKQYGDKKPDFLVQGKKYLIGTIADDLSHFKPDYILINYFVLNQLVGIDRNMLAYFSTDKKFREEWKKYHLVASIDQHDIYAREK